MRADVGRDMGIGGGPGAGDTCTAVPGGLPVATVLDTAAVRKGVHVIWGGAGVTHQGCGWGKAREEGG